LFPQARIGDLLDEVFDCGHVMGKKKRSAEPGTAQATPITGPKEQHKADAPFRGRGPSAASFGYKNRERLRVMVSLEADLTHARQFGLLSPLAHRATVRLQISSVEGALEAETAPPHPLKIYSTSGHNARDFLRDFGRSG
jgi:hypothetical protein